MLKIEDREEPIEDKIMAPQKIVEKERKKYKSEI